MGAQGRNIRLSVPRIDGYRHFLNKIWSDVRFFLMNVDDSEVGVAGQLPRGALHQRGAIAGSESVAQSAKIELGLSERYILSRLTQVTEEVDAAFSASKFFRRAQALYRFFWTELCDWYIEISKPSLSPAASPEQRRAALGTPDDVSGNDAAAFAPDHSVYHRRAVVASAASRAVRRAS